MRIKRTERGKKNISNTFPWKQICWFKHRPLSPPVICRSNNLQFGEWLKSWLIHSSAAGENSRSTDAPEHSDNEYLSHYSESTSKRFGVYVGVRTYSKCMHSVILHPCPFNWNPIPSLLIHYGSLDKYSDGTLITEINDARSFAPLYVSKSAHLQLCASRGARSRQRDSRSHWDEGNRTSISNMTRGSQCILTHVICSSSGRAELMQ